MPFVDPIRLPEREPRPGWRARFFHSEHMTFAYYDIDGHAGPVGEHVHENEEVWNVVEGRLAVTIDGEERVVVPGSAAVVPANARPAVRALTESRAIVVNYPPRRHSW
jgi:mannose-6-phosphate isomerase-like protein (cupin superfamily)